MGAASHPVRVDKAAASDWLADELAVGELDTLPVVWHSITQMYWPPDELAAVERILAGSGARQRLGEVSLEFDPHGPPGAAPELAPGCGARVTPSTTCQRHSRL